MWRGGGPEWLLIEVFIKASSNSHMNKANQAPARPVIDDSFHHVSADKRLYVTVRDRCLGLKTKHARHLVNQTLNKNN